LEGGLKMATWNLRLLPFSDFYENKPTGLGPRAYIAIKHPSDRIKWKEGRNDIVFDTISPDCTIFEESEFHVDRLINELETNTKEKRLS
jgi:hypothetical protein